MVTILSVGQDCNLLSSRAAVLMRTKAVVVNADFNNAMQALRDQRFDLVVLCHTLSTEEMIEVGRAAHELQKGARVLRVMSDTRPHAGDDYIDADDVSQSNPVSLVDKVIEMLHTDGSPPFGQSSSE